MIHLTAAHKQQLVGEWHRAGARPAAALEGVRLVNVMGDALSPHKLEQWDAIRPAHTRLINTWGPMEITISCSAAYVRHAPGMSRVSIGRPFANSRMYLLDARGEPVPVGVTGELYISGDGVARGYLNRPELSAERFVDDPFRPGSRMYKTGDLAFLLARRRRDRVRRPKRFSGEGARIPRRVERSGDAARSGGRRAGNRGAGPRGRARREAARRLLHRCGRDGRAARMRGARLARRYMMPAPYVCLPALPLTPNGKLDRNALPPPAHDADSNRGYEAPQGDIEETLARIWEQLLERERVGRHDNFFDLGGHSLLTVSLIERMRQAELHADVAALFTTSTSGRTCRLHDQIEGDSAVTANDLLALLNSKGIALSVKGDNLAITGDEKVLEDPGLLALLRANKPALIDLIKDGHGTVGGAVRVPPNRIPADAERIAPEQLTLVRLDQGEIDALVARVDGGAANVQDIYPLVPMQEGMLFHHLLSQQGDAYLESYLLTFRTREGLDRFLSALQQVIDRHDILRTAFFWEELPHSVQVVQRRATLPLNVVELDPRDGDVGQQLEARYDPRSHRIDDGRAPLMQIHAAHDAASGRWLVRLLSRHLAVDHTTLERVIEEARAIEQGRAEDLPRPEPFRHFVAQARLGVGEADHEAYFGVKLGDIDEPTAPFGLLSVQGRRA